MSLLNLFKKKEKKNRTKEDEKLEKEILGIASKLASRMIIYPKGIKALDAKAKKAVLDLMKKWELNIAEGVTYNIITINNWGENKEVFNEAVKMLCNELYRLLKIKINANDFIKEYNFEGVKLRSKFAFPVREDTGTKEEGILFNTAKKNIQAKIKENKRYKDIDLIGVRKFFVSSANLPRLLKIIENDEVFKNYNYPIFLNVQIVFYTSIFDYDRFVNFAKKINEYLDLTKGDYREVKRRIIDAVDETIMKMSKSTKIDSKKIRDMFTELSEQGAIKLIYMRNFTWDIKDLKKKPNLLKKLSNLMEFMQSTLTSKDFRKDFLAPYFEVSTDMDYTPTYGCFAIINDKAGIDESVISPSLPNTMKKV